MGNALADFVDRGGALVLTLPTFFEGWEIGGRLLSQGYIPFAITDRLRGATSLGAFDATHPIMAGVSAVRTDFSERTKLSSGSRLIASWANGDPFVAVGRSGVVGLNLFVDYAWALHDQAVLILHNAALWAGGSVEGIAVEPTRVSIAPGASAELRVDIDASGLAAGQRTRHLMLSSNDPAFEPFRPAFPFSLSGRP